jgi:hypothetical protein
MADAAATASSSSSAAAAAATSNSNASSPNNVNANVNAPEAADVEAQFLHDAHGRYPLSSNMGSAKVWADPGHPPRPDITLSSLQKWSWLGGLLGLDHFYMRSPLTGLVKLLTAGGIGIWWLWDALQVSTEGDRVVKYGLSAPFDLILGIGQGMITDKETHYEQRSAFSKWQLAAIFGFMGFDSFLIGKWGQGWRKVVEFLFLLLGIISIVLAWNDSGISGLLTFSKIIIIMMVMFFGSIVITNWGISLSSIFKSPETLFTTGIHVPEKVGSMLNSYANILDMGQYVIGGKDTVKKVKEDMNYGNIDGAELKERFAIEREEILRQEEVNRPADDDTASKNNWPKSFLIWLATLLIFFVQLAVFIVKGIIYFFFPMKAATDALASAGTAEAEAEAARRIAALQAGGARSSKKNDDLSTEAKVLGAAVIAIVGGGALKAVVDSLVAE